ncbi:DNA-formamidopyrimidine glycosylase family protein, partial [Burkholderia cepacia]|uniref:DNA-formamidopyrimidine glycosylase family protein n=1 Tax=Burkholderia cepacia TaxID=292 RepID=UPI00264B7AD0
MPELPEVEVTRRGIEPFVAGRRVERVDVRTEMLRWPVPAGLAEQLRAREVLAVERRGKYLLFEVDAGWFIVHLGMTGTLRVLPADGVPVAAKHDHMWGGARFDTARIRAREPRKRPPRKVAGDFRGSGAARKILQKIG